MLTSGFYDLGNEVSVWKVYYGEDVATYAERSSLPGSSKTTVPLFVTDAELDPDMFQEETDKLVAARAAAGKPVERVHLDGPLAHLRDLRRRHRATARCRGRCSSSCAALHGRGSTPQPALVASAAASPRKRRWRLLASA